MVACPSTPAPSALPAGNTERTPLPGLHPFIGGTLEEQQAELAARATRWTAEADTTREQREHATLAAQARRRSQWPITRIRDLMAETDAGAQQ